MRNVKATPKGTRMMWKPSVNAICSRAGTSWEGSAASATVANDTTVMAGRLRKAQAAPWPGAAGGDSSPRPGSGPLDADCAHGPPADRHHHLPRAGPLGLLGRAGGPAARVLR